MNSPTTINRRISADQDLIDLGLTGEIREWYEKLEDLDIILKTFGVEYIENPNSSIVIISPHGQAGITVHAQGQESELVNDQTAPWERKESKIGKAVVITTEEGAHKPVNPAAKESSGMGDSLSKQLSAEVVAKISGGDNEKLPNFVVPTISQSTIDSNSGNSLNEFEMSKLILPENIQQKLMELEFTADPMLVESIRKELHISNPELVPGSQEYKKAMGVLLALRMQQVFRNKIKELSLNIKNERPPLILNLHTAFDRNPEKKGNPNIDIIIGSVRGLSVSDFKVEVKLARFLKSKGFNVILTSLFTPPKEGTAVEETGVDAKLAYPREEERSAGFREWADKNGVSPDEFERDEAIEELGRLRGTQFMYRMRYSAIRQGRDINMIQMEVVRKTLADSSKRDALSSAIAEFCQLYDKGEIV